VEFPQNGCTWWLHQTGGNVVLGNGLSTLTKGVHSLSPPGFFIVSAGPLERGGQEANWGVIYMSLSLLYIWQSLNGRNPMKIMR